MSLQRVGTLIRLELTQRIRSVSWYVLLGVFFVLLMIVTALAFAVFPSSPQNSFGQPTGTGVYSIVVFFVLLLAVLVSPTLSGNAINGDRDAATLAPVQVTLATTGEILLGKFLAAWITGLAFIAVAIPFLLVAMAAGGVPPATLLVSLLILIIEIGVVAGIGVGLSGILARPLFSVAVTYLVVSALVVGTLIAFGLGGAAVTSETVHHYRSLEYDQSQELPQVPSECMTAAPGQTEPLPQCTIAPIEPEYTCGPWQTSTSSVPRFDRVWWILAANPFVVLADATPTTFRDGYPVDLFGQLKSGIRYAQQPPALESTWDDCDRDVTPNSPTAEEIIESSTPSWFVGLAIQLALAAGLLWWGWARTRTPARRLPPGTRIA
ncbi:MAG TPA: ABC transporter permease [Microbacterium sp.]|nr:ABC transporter permease [Microbacterium sp.]